MVPMTISRGPLTLRGACCLLAAFALIITALVAVIPTARASENVPGTHIGYPNTFFVYANAGEEIHAAFTKGVNTTAFSDVTVNLAGPGFAGATCHFPVTSTAGTVCDFGGPVVATQSGIWKVEFVVNDGSVQTHYPGLLLARGTFQWDIAVSSGGGEIPGRVWSDAYYMSQPLPDQPGGAFHDLEFWFQSEFGVLYELKYLRFNGIHSVFEANPVGNRYEGTCQPAYRSIFFNDAAFSPADGECGEGAFKVFFDRPDPTLPASALRWDGGTEWINPPVPDAPEILNLAFTPDSPDINSGLLTFGLTNFPSGSVIVKVDTDGDGVFDGPGDCSTHVAAVGGAVEYPFDGFTCGADPQPIPPSQEIGFEVTIDNIAEIHFTNFDVEGRGGIEVTQLTGPGAGDTTIHWDDSYLNLDRDDDPERNFAVPPLGRNDVSTPNVYTWLITTWPGCHPPGPVKGPGCASPTFVGDGVDSSGGVHGWEFNPEGGQGGLALGWGNNRYIDDWKFVDIADVVQTLTVPPRTSTFAIAKSSDPVSGSEVEPGDVITYNVAITNLDTPDAVSLPGVIVNDDLSDVLDDATVTSGPTATSGSVAIVGDTLTWEGDLAAGATVTVTYQVTVNALDDLGDRELRNVVSTTDERSVNCPPGDPGPECETEHVVVERTSTFAIDKSSDPVSGSEVEPGDEITYDVTITNLDDPDAVAIEGVVVNDDLSDVLDDATVTSGPTTTSGSVSITGDTLTWEGDLAPGATVTVTYTVTVNDEDDLGDRVLRNVVSSGDERAVNCPPGDPGPECSTDHEVPEPPTPPGPETEVGGETEVPETEVGGATQGALAFTGAGFGYLVLVALMMLGAGVALFETTRRRARMHRS